MIVQSKRERIRFLWVRQRRSVKSIARAVGLSEPNVREHLRRLRLVPHRKLKSAAQRKALARLRAASGKRTLGTSYVIVEHKLARHKPRVWMSGWFGFMRDTEVRVYVKDVGAGAGEIKCRDCMGTGEVDWSGQLERCVGCKGSGRTFVSI